MTCNINQYFISQFKMYFYFATPSETKKKDAPPLF